MALSLGVVKGSRIKVGTTMLEVTFMTAGILEVKVDGEYSLLVSDKEKIQLMPLVFLSCGVTTMKEGATSSRLAIEAPKEVKIVRVGVENVKPKH